jgi:hypothetical protein
MSDYDVSLISVLHKSFNFHITDNTGMFRRDVNIAIRLSTVQCKKDSSPPVTGKSSGYFPVRDHKKLRTAAQEPSVLISFKDPLKTGIQLQGVNIPQVRNRTRGQ